MSRTTKRKRSVSSTNIKRRKSTLKRTAKPANSTFKPVKLGKRKYAAEKKKTDGSGPLEWLLPMMESAYTSLAAHDASARSVTTMAISSLNSIGPAVIAPAGSSVWRDVFLEYKQRKAAAIAPPAAPAAGAPPAPF